MSRSVLPRLAVVLTGAVVLSGGFALPALATPTPVEPTSLTISTPRSVVGPGVKYEVDGTLTRAGQAAPGKSVELLTRAAGATAFTLVRNLNTDGSGKLRFILTETRNVSLMWHYVGDATSAPSSSPVAAVLMKPAMTGAFSDVALKLPATTTFAGTVTKGLGATLRFQRHTSTGWHTLAIVTPSSTGAFSYTYRPGNTGTYAFRMALPASAGYLMAASPNRVLQVDLRDLGNGDRGADVLALEKKLASLHYSPGKVDGVFDRDLQHAVITYEKVQVLPRNGTWSRAERVHLAHPRVMTVRFRSSGRAVEVDVTRQVLVYSERGAVVLVVDTSTGGEYRYSYTGGSDIAHTPRGHFVIQRKINGVRTSKLGYLYRPSYFTGGFAVHGEGYDVPSHPASHGCVRITNYNTDLLYSRLAVGTPVTVFDE